MCNFILRIAAKYKAAKRLIHFLLSFCTTLSPPVFPCFILTNIANGNTLPIAADYVWKILAFWSQDPLGTTYKLHKIKFHFQKLNRCTSVGIQCEKKSALEPNWCISKVLLLPMIALMQKYWKHSISPFIQCRRD